MKQKNSDVLVKLQKNVCIHWISIHFSNFYWRQVHKNCFTETKEDERCLLWVVFFSFKNDLNSAHALTGILRNLSTQSPAQ